MRLLDLGTVLTWGSLIFTATALPMNSQLLHNTATLYGSNSTSAAHPFNLSVQNNTAALFRANLTNTAVPSNLSALKNNAALDVLKSRPFPSDSSVLSNTAALDGSSLKSLFAAPNAPYRPTIMTVGKVPHGTLSKRSPEKKPKGSKKPKTPKKPKAPKDPKEPKKPKKEKETKYEKQLRKYLEGIEKEAEQTARKQYDNKMTEYKNFQKEEMKKEKIFYKEQEREYKNEQNALKTIYNKMKNEAKEQMKKDKKEAKKRGEKFTKKLEDYWVDPKVMPYKPQPYQGSAKKISKPVWNYGKEENKVATATTAPSNIGSDGRRTSWSGGIVDDLIPPRPDTRISPPQNEPAPAPIKNKNEVKKPEKPKSNLILPSKDGPLGPIHMFEHHEGYIMYESGGEMKRADKGSSQYNLLINIEKLKWTEPMIGTWGPAPKDNPSQATATSPGGPKLPEMVQRPPSIPPKIPLDSPEVWDGFK